LGIDIRNSHTISCKFHTFLTYTFMQISSYILVAVTFNRLIIMFNRHTLFWKKRRINLSKDESIKSVLYITAGITLIVSIMNLHFLYFYELDSSSKENKFSNRCTVVDRLSNYYKFRTQIYGQLHLYVFVIVPCFLLFIMNLLIIKKLLSPIRRASLVKSAFIMNKKNKQRRSLSIMLIAVCLWFVVLKTPASVYVTLPVQEMKKDYYPFTYSLFMLINYTNHAVNLIIYVLISSSFRKEIKIFFCGKSFRNDLRTNSITVRL
jgi:hypothetical protein